MDYRDARITRTGLTAWTNGVNLPVVEVGHCRAEEEERGTVALVWLPDNRPSRGFQCLSLKGSSGSVTKWARVSFLSAHFRPPTVRCCTNGAISVHRPATNASLTGVVTKLSQLCVLRCCAFSSGWIPAVSTCSSPPPPPSMIDP